MTYILILLLGGTGLFLIYYLSSIYLIRLDSYIKFKREELEYKKNKDLLDFNNLEKSELLMDSLVSENLNRWSLENISNEESSYIKDSKSDEILHYIIFNTINNLTPYKKKILSVAFKMDSTDEMVNSIKRVAIIHVMKFVVDQNSIDYNNTNNPNTTFNFYDKK